MKPSFMTHLVKKLRGDFFNCIIFMYQMEIFCPCQAIDLASACSEGCPVTFFGCLNFNSFNN